MVCSEGLLSSFEETDVGAVVTASKPALSGICHALDEDGEERPPNASPKIFPSLSLGFADFHKLIMLMNTINLQTIVCSLIFLMMVDAKDTHFILLFSQGRGSLEPLYEVVNVGEKASFVMIPQYPTGAPFVLKIICL